MENDKKSVSLLIKNELTKIAEKKNKILFFVVDTKGSPNSALANIYEMALCLSKDGYDVSMLYDTKEFTGVESWMGKEYSDLKHIDASSAKIDVSASDVLVIQDIFATVMNQTKDLPCKRIILVQNLNYLTEMMPLGIQLGDYKIFDCITISEKHASIIKEWFPYVRTTVIKPCINDKIFHPSMNIKKLVVNVVSKDRESINKIIKPFYWEFPAYKWVSFKDVRNASREDFGDALRDGAITIWVDDDSSFGYSALSAMKSGSLVIAKIPDILPEWAKNGEEDTLKNCCIWFENYQDIPKIIGNVILSWTNDSIPVEIVDEAKKVADSFQQSSFEKDTLDYFNSVIGGRKAEMEKLIDEINKDKKE